MTAKSSPLLMLPSLLISYTSNANLVFWNSSVPAASLESPTKNSMKDTLPSLFVSKIDNTLFTKGFYKQTKEERDKKERDMIDREID